MLLVNLLVNLFLVCLAIGLAAANEQKVVQDNWVFDKMSNSNIEVNGSRLTARFEFEFDGFSPYFNALYLGIVANETNKRFYWEFNCVKNCDMVGIAKKDNYNPDGRSIVGAFFSGDLMASSTWWLVSEFGDYIEDGDRIGFILDAGEQALKIYLVHNDRPLGLAYIQKAPYSSELYPAVLFRESPGIVEINEKKNVNTDHLLVRGDYPKKGIRGEYKLVKVNGAVQDVEGYFLRLENPKDERDKSDSSDLCMCVCWRIPTLLYFGSGRKLEGDIVKKGKDAGGDLYKFVQPLTEPDHVMGRASKDSETISTSIENLKRIKFSDDFDQLTIISTDPHTTLLFKRFVREKPPYETSDLLA